MSNETIPLNLFKANLELQLRLQRLVQENGQQWLENATRAGTAQIFMRCIQNRLCVGQIVNGRDRTVFNAKLFMNDFNDWG